MYPIMSQLTKPLGTHGTALMNIEDRQAIDMRTGSSTISEDDSMLRDRVHNWASKLDINGINIMGFRVGIGNIISLFPV